MNYQNIQEEKEQEIQELSKIEETMTKTYKMFTMAKFRVKTIRNRNG